MDLWIRSQDKECLMKVNRVDYDLSNSEHRIIVNGYETLVGHYETKERALEVLDEIQDLFNLSIQNETFERNDLIIKSSMLPKVYQMPKD